MFRPKPDAPSRQRWNSFHWWFGRIALLVAWVNFYFGLIPFNKIMDAGAAESDQSANPLWQNRFDLFAYAAPAVSTLIFIVLQCRKSCDSGGFSPLNESINGNQNGASASFIIFFGVFNGRM